MVTFAIDNTTSAYEMSVSDAYVVLAAIGFPPQDYGMNLSLDAADFTLRIRGAFQLNVMYPVPGRDEVLRRFRELIEVGERARATGSDVSWSC